MNSRFIALSLGTLLLLSCQEPTEHEAISLDICVHKEPTREVVDSSGSIVKLVPDRAMPELDGACWLTEDEDTIAIRFSVGFGCVATVDLLDEDGVVTRNVVEQCDVPVYYEYYFVPNGNDVFGVRYSSECHSEVQWYRP